MGGGANVMLCDSVDIPDYQVHIPAEVFLVETWIDKAGEFAQQAVDAIAENAGEVVIDLFDVKTAMELGMRKMNGKIRGGNSLTAVTSVPKW